MLRAIFRQFSRFCSGCGSAFQHSDASLEGYIPENRYKNTLIQNTKAELILKDIKSSEISPKDFKLTGEKKSPREKNQKPQFQELDSIEEIEERIKSAIPLHELNQKVRIRPLVCMRCYKLSHYGQLADVKVDIASKSSESLLEDIFNMVKFNSIIIQVVDLLDFNGSLLKEVFERSLSKKSHVILVVNKIDALPLEAKLERIYRWTIDQTRELSKNLDVVPLSARTGEGYDRLLRILKELKENNSYSKVFVLGATNSGKSSFINRLARKCWNLPQEKFKNPELTTSSYAGTTLTPVEVSLRSLEMKVVDTPGIPTLSQITAFMSDEDCKLVIPNKRIKPVVLTATTNFAFWIGALVRVEMVSGDFKYLTFFNSHMCTVHKTKKSKVEEVFEKQAGKLLRPGYSKEIEWEVYKVNLNCKSKEKATKDLVIHGLGWISVTGFGLCEFQVRVAKGVGFNVRDPIMPYEAKPERVQYTKGKTVNIEKYKNKKDNKLKK
jgi:ribosome biogenesis GTPase A